MARGLLSKYWLSIVGNGLVAHELKVLSVITAPQVIASILAYQAGREAGAPSHRGGLSAVSLNQNRSERHLAKQLSGRSRG